jgi:hypothetical protein
MGKITVSVCDFCGAKTDYPAIEQWYRVSSLRWPMPKNSVEGDPCELKRMDACLNCGARINYILTSMGVSHEHSAPRKDSTGFILVY